MIKNGRDVFNKGWIERVSRHRQIKTIYILAAVQNRYSVVITEFVQRRGFSAGQSENVIFNRFSVAVMIEKYFTGGG